MCCAVLNTLTEYHFQDALKKCRNTENDAYERKRHTLKVMVTSRPKISF
jgi:hypothetical protein